MEEATNVTARFDLLLILLIISSSLDLLYEVAAIGAAYHKALKIFKKVLRVKDLLGIAVIVLLHLFRLSHSGRVCSGSFL